MITSEKVDAVLPALLAATIAIGHGVEKGNTANAGKKSYKYADLADVLALARPHLEAAGLVLVSSQPSDDVVVTRCYHVASGQWVESCAQVSVAGEQAKEFGPKGAQAAGSAYTYGRRYSIMALLSLAGEDDDGQATRRDTHRKIDATQEPAAAPVFSPAEISYAVAQGWKEPATWPVASQARYRADLDAGKVKVSS